jgi:hypothetical protein
LDPKEILEHLRGHSRELKAFELRSILERLGPVGSEEFFAANPKPFHCIEGILAFRTPYCCAEAGCEELLEDLESVRGHYSASHTGKKVRVRPKRSLQSIFGANDQYRVVMEEGECLDGEGNIVAFEGTVINRPRQSEGFWERLSAGTTLNPRNHLFVSIKCVKT